MKNFYERIKHILPVKNIEHATESTGIQKKNRKTTSFIKLIIYNVGVIGIISVGASRIENMINPKQSLASLMSEYDSSTIKSGKLSEEYTNVIKNNAVQLDQADQILQELKKQTNILGTMKTYNIDQQFQNQIDQQIEYIDKAIRIIDNNKERVFLISEDVSSIIKGIEEYQQQSLSN